MKKLSSSSGCQSTNRTASVSNIHAPVVLRVAAALGRLAMIPYYRLD